MFQDS